MKNWIDDNFDVLFNELLELVHIPSVSAQSEHQDDLIRAAEFIAEYLQSSGLQTVQLMPTAGNPVVFGSHQVDPQLPTVLIYGHYDVQPPEPLDKWLSP